MFGRQAGEARGEVSGEHQILRKAWVVDAPALASQLFRLLHSRHRRACSNNRHSAGR